MRKLISHVFTERETCQMNLSNKSFEPTNDKLINQTSCKYVRRVICLVLIISTKCQ